jgi:hypothetical protein
VISTTLSGDTPAELRLTWRTKPKARQALEEELFGKRILFTDKDENLASTSTIVTDYRSQEDAEADFRQLKDPKVVFFSPMFHWTDHTIRVHTLSCVLALIVARLMVGEADRNGVHLSMRAPTGGPRGNPGDRAAVPRRPRSAPRPTDAHQDGPHPAASLRHLRPRHLRSPALSWVIHPPGPETPPDLRQRRIRTD